MSRCEHASVTSYRGLVRQILQYPPKPWAGTTCDQACSAFRRFGRHMLVLKLLQENPFDLLETSGEANDPGDRPGTTEEIRRLIQCSVARCTGDRRVRTNAALYWLFLAKTGLRAWEEAPKVAWGHVHGLDGPLPHLWTEKEWSKNKRRMRVPIGAELARLLNQHRRCVPGGAGDRIFPKIPNRATFNVDRGSALIIPKTGDGIFGAHSLRKFLASELDRCGCSAGVRYKIMRHAGNITESRYTATDLEDEVAAVNRLPDLWPATMPVPILRSFPQSGGFSISHLTQPGGIPDDVGVTPVGSQFSDQPTPRSGGSPAGVTTSPTGCCAGLGGPGDGNARHLSDVPREGEYQRPSVSREGDDVLRQGRELVPSGALSELQGLGMGGGRVRDQGGSGSTSRPGQRDNVIGTPPVSLSNLRHGNGQTSATQTAVSNSAYPVTSCDAGVSASRESESPEKGELWSHDTGNATPAGARRELGRSGVTAGETAQNTEGDEPDHRPASGLGGAVTTQPGGDAGSATADLSSNHGDATRRAGAAGEGSGLTPAPLDPVRPADPGIPASYPTSPRSTRRTGVFRWTHGDADGYHGQDSRSGVDTPVREPGGADTGITRGNGAERDPRGPASGSMASGGHHPSVGQYASPEPAGDRRGVHGAEVGHAITPAPARATETNTWDGPAEAGCSTTLPRQSCPTFQRASGPNSPENSSTYSRERTATPSASAISQTFETSTNYAIRHSATPVAGPEQSAIPSSRHSESARTATEPESRSDLSPSEALAYARAIRQLLIAAGVITAILIFSCRTLPVLTVAAAPQVADAADSRGA